MPNKTPEELIHGLVDDELSSEEQLRAQQLLAERADLRQLHDDLRALRSSLTSLARYHAPATLQAEVMRRVENAAQASRPESLAEKPARVVLRFPRGLRPWLWPAAALAAAVALMIVNWQPERERPELADAALRRAPDAAIGPAPEGSRTPGKSSAPPDAIQDVEGDESGSLVKSKGDATTPDAKRDGRARASGDRLSPARNNEVPADESRRSLAKRSAEGVAPGSATSRLADQDAASAQTEVNSFARKDSSTLNRPEHAAKKARAARRAGSASGLQIENSARALADADHDLLVLCYFKPNTAPTQAVNTALNRQKLAADSLLFDLKQSKDKEGKRNEVHERLDYYLGLPEPEQVLYAEGTPLQVQRALEDLNSNKDVLVMEVQASSPDPTQQTLSRYNRGQVANQLYLGRESNLGKSSSGAPSAAAPLTPPAEPSGSAKQFGKQGEKPAAGVQRGEEQQSSTADEVKRQSSQEPRAKAQKRPTRIEDNFEVESSTSPTDTAAKPADRGAQQRLRSGTKREQGGLARKGTIGGAAGKDGGFGGGGLGGSGSGITTEPQDAKTMREDGDKWQEAPQQQVAANRLRVKFLLGNAPESAETADPAAAKSAPAQPALEQPSP